MSIAEVIIEKVSDNAKSIAFSAVGVVATAIATHTITKKQDDKILQKEKVKSYKKGASDGVQIGKQTALEVYGANTLARVSMAYYIEGAKGFVTAKEKKLLKKQLKPILDNPEYPKSIKNEIVRITNMKSVGFDIVSSYLDKADLESINNFIDELYNIANLDNNLSKDEQEGIETLKNYLTVSYNDERYQEKAFTLVANKRIKEATNNYSLKMKLLDASFSMKTKLNKKEISLLMGAVALQCFRIYYVNYSTKIEKAGNKNIKESFLHKQQERLLKQFDNGKEYKAKPYYAPLNQIITTRGVPYDVTHYEVKDTSLFQGANHRFSTLGHDPLLGLLIGTTNIMTNTITTICNDAPLPTTYHVNYDQNFKKPIISNNASLLLAVNKSIDRTTHDLKPLVASVIKQLIHIATDTYTPAGIQLPGESLVLTKGIVEKITSCISYGDIVKACSSNTMNQFFNRIVAIIHNYLLLQAGEDPNNKLNIVKTIKIIGYSNYIATSSNIITKSITGDYKNLDWAGLITLITTSFNSVDFVYEVKRDFISNSLGEVDISNY